MSYFRSLSFALAAAGLVALTGGNSNPTAGTTSTSSDATHSPGNSASHSHHGGKPKININSAILLE